MFLPWDADTVGSVSSGEDLHALHPRNLSLSQRELLRRNMTWLQRDPTRFLYCHQRHTTVQFKNLVDPDTFLLSSEFRDNMACYVFYVDPWRVLCRAVSASKSMTFGFSKVKFNRCNAWHRRSVIRAPLKWRRSVLTRVTSTARMMMVAHAIARSKRSQTQS